MRRFLLSGVAVAAVSAGALGASRTQGSAPQNHALSPADLQSTWKLVSLTYDGQPQKATGYMVFQGGHYSFVTNRERPRLPAGAGDKPPAQLNPEEVRAYVEAFRNMTAAAGPFSNHHLSTKLAGSLIQTQ